MENPEYILLVDDDPEYVPLIQIAFQEANVSNPVRVVIDASEAMRYLRGEGCYADRSLHPLPVLIVMDLRMPGMNGFELLHWLRSQPGMSTMPVAVLTGSEFTGEARRASEAGANAFHLKPFEFTKLVEILQDVSARFLRRDWRKAA